MSVAVLDILIVLPTIVAAIRCSLISACVKEGTCSFS